MFDSACRNMSAAEMAEVNCEALRNVKALLSASHPDPTAKEAQRLEGGADAKETESKIDTDRIISSDTENPHVGGNAPEGATHDDRVDVANAAPALGKGTQRSSGEQP